MILTVLFVEYRATANFQIICNTFPKFLVVMKLPAISNVMEFIFMLITEHNSVIFSDTIPNEPVIIGINFIPL